MKDSADRFMTTAIKRPGGPETILLVEDDLVVREMTCEILSRNGYLVLTAESERQALKAWERFGRHIDLLLTDVMIPHRSNGLELARKFLRMKPELKIVFTSGFGPEICSGVPALTGGLFLAKPYSAGTLLRTIATCLNTEEESTNELN
jgi:two-component system, cell cycle sensor histidine kinase and response regulator CckA